MQLVPVLSPDCTAYFPHIDWQLHDNKMHAFLHIGGGGGAYSQRAKFAESIMS